MNHQTPNQPRPPLVRRLRCAALFSLVVILGCTRQPLADGQLSYYLAAKTKPIVGEPTPDGGMPSGADWVSDTYITPIGVRVPIVRRRVPELTFSMDEVERVTLAPSPLERALLPSSTTVGATLTVAAEIAAVLDSIGRQYQGYCLLVRSGDRMLDCAPVFADLPHSAPGGVFASEEDAREFYKQIKERLVVTLSSPDEELQWRAYFERFVVAMSWRLKCDSEFQDGLERDGYDSAHLSEMMLTFGHRLDDLACSDTPPELPNAP